MEFVFEHVRRSVCVRACLTVYACSLDSVSVHAIGSVCVFDCRVCVCMPLTVCVRAAWVHSTEECVCLAVRVCVLRGR
jgi:hypothetical protein